MGSILNDAERTSICQRIASVTSASVPRWGQMDAKAMLNHLKLSALMALGELPVANKSMRAFQVFPIKHLILHVVPFPKGAPTARSCWSPTRRRRRYSDRARDFGGAQSGRTARRLWSVFTHCLVGSRSASGAWRRTSTRTITYDSSRHSVKIVD